MTAAAGAAGAAAAAASRAALPAACQSTNRAHMGLSCSAGPAQTVLGMVTRRASTAAARVPSAATTYSRTTPSRRHRAPAATRGLTIKRPTRIGGPGRAGREGTGAERVEGKQRASVCGKESWYGNLGGCAARAAPRCVRCACCGLRVLFRDTTDASEVEARPRHIHGVVVRAFVWCVCDSVCVCVCARACVCVCVCGGGGTRMQARVPWLAVHGQSWRPRNSSSLVLRPSYCCEPAGARYAAQGGR